jgi:O-antigen/teichoic acid export membrane protein
LLSTGSFKGGEKISMTSNFILAKRNIVWSSASVISKLLSGFIISIIIARSPNLELIEVGQIFYAISLGVVISLFVDYGLDTYMIKGIASEKNNKNEFNYFLGLRLILSLFVFGLFLMLVNFITFSFQEKILTILIVLSYIVSVLNRTYLAYFQSQHQFNIESIISFTGDAVLLLLVFLSLNYTDNIIYIGYSYVVVRVITLFLSTYFISKKDIPLLPKFNIEIFKKYLKDSFSFGLLAILATTCIYLDIILLRLLAIDNPEAQVAYFQIAMQFVIAATLIPSIVAKGLLPILSLNNNQEAIYFKVNNILMTLGVLLFIFIVMYGEQLILLVYGEKYLPVLTALQIVGIVVAMRFGAMYNIFITIKGNNWLRVLGSLSMLTTGVMANIILIPLYGLEGSAISSVASHIVIWIVYLHVIKKMGYPILLGWNLYKASVISFIFILLMLAIQDYMVYVVLPMVLTFGLLSVLFVLNDDDRKILFNRVLHRGY